MFATSATTVEADPLPPLPAGWPSDFPALITGLRLVWERGNHVLVERIADTRGRAWLPLASVRLHATDYFMTEWSATVPAGLYRKVRTLL